MAQGKVEICGVNTAKLPILKEEEKEALFVRANTIEERFGYPAMAPYSGGCVDLLTGEILSAGVREPKKAAEKPSKARKQNAFERVVAAAKHLLQVVYKNEGLANKELAKFETQIQNLADKWDR